MLTIQLPIEAEKGLEALVAETGKSKDFHMREALLEYLADIEDVRQAEQCLDDIRAGKEHTVPLEEVLKRYGMAD